MLKVVETFPYEIRLGQKVIKFRSWKTKDEKAYLILTESKDEITDQDLYETLILPCLEDKDTYLTNAELQKVIIEIRKKSLGESFEVKFICQNEKCKKINDAEISFDDIVNFREDTVKDIKIGNIEFFFGTIKNSKLFEEKIKDKTQIETVFIEMVMRVEKLIIDDTLEDSFSFDEVYDYMDNLDSQVFDELLEYYMANTSSIKLEGTARCMSCGTPNEFIFDEIPNFLAEW